MDCRAPTALWTAIVSSGSLRMAMSFIASPQHHEGKRWLDDVTGHPEFLIYWDGLNASEPSWRAFLRLTRELSQLRCQYPALREEGFRVIHVQEKIHLHATARAWQAQETP